MPNPSSTSSPYPLPEEIRNLLADVETFVADILKGENLSKKAKEKRDSLIKKLKDVKSIYLQEFQDKGDAEDGEEYDDPFAGPPDTVSLASERYDKDDEASDGNQFPPIAAQDLPFVLKSGYLEKRRKDHSFLGFEWQKRWCALSKTVFYYYGSDKDKQQKGEFAMDGYSVRMNNTLRKDGKKDCCFEISAPDKRIYQFTAASPKDAEEWVQQLQFVLQDMGSDVIPEEEDERGELYDDVDHPLPVGSSPPRGQPADDEIYEELPEEEEEGDPEKEEGQRKMSQDSVHHTTGDKSTDYANFYQGLWDCTGDLSDELSFKRGDVIYILSKSKMETERTDKLLKVPWLSSVEYCLQPTSSDSSPLVPPLHQAPARAHKARPTYSWCSCQFQKNQAERGSLPSLGIQSASPVATPVILPWVSRIAANDPSLKNLKFGLFPFTPDLCVGPETLVQLTTSELLYNAQRCETPFRVMPFFS